MRAEQPPVIEIVDLTAGYTDVDVLHGVNITVRAGTLVSIVGPNGAGKSTLLKAIYGLVPRRSGRVVLRRDGAEYEVLGLSPHRLTALGVNYVPQLDNVFPNLTVRENLEMGAYTRPRAAGDRLRSAYDLFPLLRERERQRAGTLSAGQRQMLALARALMSEPHVLLLDEPSAGLAPAIVKDVFDKILDISASGIAVVIVEQNARRALAMADHGYVLDMGRNRFEGRGSELLQDERVVDLYLGGGRGRLAGRTITEEENGGRGA